MTTWPENLMHPSPPLPNPTESPPAHLLLPASLGGRAGTPYLRPFLTRRTLCGNVASGVWRPNEDTTTVRENVTCTDCLALTTDALLNPPTPCARAPKGMV